MVTLPTKGFLRSVKKSNIRLDIMCDWIEASVLFMNEELSTIDIIDVLVEEEICPDEIDVESEFQGQTMASSIVEDAWVELRQRRKWMEHACPFEMNNKWIRASSSWQKRAPYTFCLLLSLSTYYDWWLKKNGQDYTEQGDLFELLTQQSIQALDSHSYVHQTGWTRTNTSGLKAVVDKVTDMLGERIGNLELWNDPNAKELGLDLCWFRPFPDKRAGIPVYLVQCASGGTNWKSKRKTPDLDIWCSVIDFTTRPKRAFSVPFALLGKEFSQSCVIVQGVFLDRHRLLFASKANDDWISKELSDRIISWSSSRINNLLAMSS